MSRLEKKVASPDRAPSPWPRRVRRALANLSLLAASALLAVALAEWAVRRARPQQLVLLRPDIWRPDSLLGHRRRENVDTHINVGAGRVHVATDASGYRIDPTAPPPVPGHHRVLMLGDSFIEALNVEYVESIPARSQILLQEHLGVPVRVDNAAVAGWDPNQYLLEARLALRQGPYALGVVYLFIANDIVSERKDSYPPRPYATRHQLRWPRGLGKREWIRAVFYPINDILETRSHLYILFKESLRVQLAKLGLTARERIPFFFTQAQAGNRCWQVTADICKDIETEFSRQQTPVLFVLLPTNYQVHTQIFAEYIESFGTDPAMVDLELPNRRLQEEFEARGLRLLDPLAHMRGQAAVGVRMYPRADIHFNAEGHRVVSEFVVPVLAEALGSLRQPLRHDVPP